MYGYYYTMSFRIMNSFRHFISAIFLSSIVSAAHAGDLVVLVENVKSDQGTVRVAIFNNAKKFVTVHPSTKAGLRDITL